MTPEKPSLDLLRRLTDRHVVGAVVDHGRQTRAELASTTGLSKPTVADSVRRLEAAGVLADTGERSSGPGRAGLYYDLAPGTGTALAVAIAPEGVVAEVLDVRGAIVGRGTAQVSRPARPATAARALERAARSAVEAGRGAGAGPVLLSVVSAADPVDRATGRLVHLPDAPFLVGALDPAAVLSDLVEGPVVVGNDVNWSALAELAARAQQAPGGTADAAPRGTPDAGTGPDATPADFAYLYLGEGLGCAVVADGRVLEGAHGLAGEVAHVVVTGARGRATAFTEVFAELGLRHEGATAIDVDRLLDVVHGGGAGGERALRALAVAVSDVVSALVALTDPQEVVLGGSWGGDRAIVEAVRDRVGDAKRPAVVSPATVPGAALAGARARAVASLRSHLVERGAGPATA
ncbi:ROK family transcriptional regulator [Pedococcus sp. NPDC057267]|uniref:ROK family transcriptional regulator n=1 Tax=Pedococcus sp. NPDC057267 TaxID=3346077 RepID=UPI00363E998E